MVVTVFHEGIVVEYSESVVCTMDNTVIRSQDDEQERVLNEP